MQILGLSIELFKNLLSKAWEAVSWTKGYDGNKKVVSDIFRPYVAPVVKLVSSIKVKVREFIVEGFLTSIGAMGARFSFEKPDGPST